MKNEWEISFGFYPGLLAGFRTYKEKLKTNTQNKLEEKDITDHDRYILSHKLDVIKEIRV